MRNFRFSFVCAMSFISFVSAFTQVEATVPTLQKFHAKVIKNCTTCHRPDQAIKGNAFVVPDDTVCMGCHGSYEELAKKTANLKVPNPHDSHHYGSGLACTACHSEHQKPQAYCSQCHPFSYKMPQ